MRQLICKGQSHFVKISIGYLSLLTGHLNKWETRNLVWSRVLPKMIVSIQEHPTLPLSLQKQKAAGRENAESEMGTFWMNNASVNETAALLHDMLENYRHTQLEGTSPDFTFSSEPSTTSL